MWSKNEKLCLQAEKKGNLHGTERCAKASTSRQNRERFVLQNVGVGCSMSHPLSYSMTTDHTDDHMTHMRCI